ncbi:MAG TPA: 5'-3' exonuclease [Solirubrobacteraceae bacterium]|nr:5'-3' exonuclease [Solirubrobacteraceae bacterium]
MPAPLLVADVPWLLYRSYFALPKSITDERGEPVNALLGTVNVMLALLETPPPSGRPRAIVACTGAEQATYRVELYPPYHGHREPMPAELAAQWCKAPGLLESFGWSVPGSADLEADDVMFSVARDEQERGGRALLVTGDRDLYAAASAEVAVLELGKGGAPPVELGPEQVRERYGVEPQQVPDFIALRGDPSDGLPGAPGIGAKTAAELLREHGTLERLLAAAHAPLPPLRPRIVGALLDNEELLLRFKRVATLQRIDVAPLAERETDFAAGAAHVRELGMRRLAERLEKLARA